MQRSSGKSGRAVAVNAPGPSGVYRRFCGVLILNGALVVAGAWRGGSHADFVVALGLGLAAIGTLGRARSMPSAAALSPPRPLAKRPELAGWTPRNVSGAAVSALFMLIGPASCINGSMQSNPTVDVIAGTLLFAAGWGGFLAYSPREAFSWHAQRKSAKARAERPLETWTWDRAWNPRGEKRLFLHYLRTRTMFAGAMCALFSLLLVPVPATDSRFLVGAKLVVGVGAAVWMLRVWRIFGMGDAFVGFRRFPFHPGERVLLTFGVSAGGAEIHDATFVLRRFRERRDGLGAGGGAPLATATIEEKAPPASRVFEPGMDQEIAFDLPADAEGTTISSWQPSYWELEVRGRTREGVYEERFLVPIYERPTAPDAAAGTSTQMPVASAAPGR